jgi:hypothetical protein
MRERKEIRKTSQVDPPEDGEVPEGPGASTWECGGYLLNNPGWCNRTVMNYTHDYGVRIAI